MAQKELSYLESFDDSCGWSFVSYEKCMDKIRDNKILFRSWKG